MKKLQGIVFGIGLGCVVSTSALAGKFDCSFDDVCCFKPSVGIGAEAQYRITKLEKNYGGNGFFRHEYPQGYFFGQVKLNDCIGLEFGYEKTMTRRQLKVLLPGEVLLGQTTDLGPDDFDYWHQTSKLHAYNLSLHGFIPICYGFSLNPFVGVQRTKVNFNALRIVEDTTAVDPEELSSEKNFFKASRTHLKLGVNALQKLNSCVSLRLGFTYQNTKGLNAFSNKGNSFQVRLKNSFVYGIGLIIS